MGWQSQVRYSLASNPIHTTRKPGEIRDVSDDSDIYHSFHHTRDFTEDLSPEERIVLRLLKTHTHEEVSELTGWSRGRIYRLVVRLRARKNELKIRERAAERRRRQLEFLREIINTTATSDVLDFLDGLLDNSVQMFRTSPPYNLGKKYGDCPGANAMRAVYYHGWLMRIASEKWPASSDREVWCS